MQNHPLYSIDRDNVDRLLGKDWPEDADIVDLSRLLIRYKDFPGAVDIKDDLQKILNQWNLSLDELNTKSRNIWSSGFRPGGALDEDIGSGFDSSSKE